MESHLESIRDALKSKFNRFRSAIESNVAEIRNEVKKLARQNNQLLLDSCTHLDDTLKAVENNPKSCPTTSAPAEEIIAGLNKCSRRISNVIMLNMKESNVGKDRLDENRAHVSDVPPPTLAASIDNFKLRRLGRPSLGRNRPLLVETSSPAEALTILKSKPPASTDGSQISFT